MNNEMILSIVLAVISMVNGWGWVTNRRKYKVEVKKLEVAVTVLVVIFKVSRFFRI